MGFSQWLVFVQRDEKGEAVIRREYLGSEFTVGSQELDSIGLAGPADVKGGSGCHTAGLPDSRPAAGAPGSPEDGKQATVRNEMSRGTLGAEGWGQWPDCFWLPLPAWSWQRWQFLAEGWLNREVGSGDFGHPGSRSAVTLGFAEFPRACELPASPQARCSPSVSQQVGLSLDGPWEQERDRNTAKVSLLKRHLVNATTCS